MTTEEKTSNRSLYFSSWMRNNLNGSDTGLIIQDIDFILRNYKDGSFILMEEKTRNKDLSMSQEKTYRLLDNILKLADENGLIKYKGFFLVKFSHTTFDDGVCYITRPFSSSITVVIPKTGCDYTPRNELEKIGSQKWLKNLLNI